MRLVTIVLTMAVSASAWPDTAVETPKAQTAQQLFDAASEAMTKGRCPEALESFEALAARPVVLRSPKLMATIRLREVGCLVSLGRLDEATSDIDSALPVLNGDDPDARVDVALAHLALGKIAYTAFDYENATREFELAKLLLHSDEQFETLTWLARSTMFEPDIRAVDYADQLLTLADAPPAATKAGMASVHTLHARALMNHGQQVAAYAELKDALREQGGLTLKVNVSDIDTRADLALAAMLTGDKEKAREYLAYTGAGRSAREPFARASSMNPPPCGGSAELEPDDFAVVEFSIGDNGAVSNVSPIYASRNGPIAAEFARAVAGWSWKPEDAKEIPLLFRAVTRVELRCSTVSAHPDVLSLLAPDLTKWLSAHHVQPFQYPPGQRPSVEFAKAELNRREGTSEELGQVPVLMSLAAGPVMAPSERQRWLRQARDILARSGAPVGALTFLDAQLSDAMAREHPDYAGLRAYLRTLLANSTTAADPHAAGTLRLLIAQTHYGLSYPPDAFALLSATADDPALPPRDPLRIGALVRLASLEAASKDLVAARESYAKTGLSAQQCTWVDATPSLKTSGYADFPREAQEWGFEGWVRVEFDIQADGKTTNRRAVVAYPPLVFRDAATNAMAYARYEQSYRPEGGLGCSGKVTYVNFKLNR